MIPVKLRDASTRVVLVAALAAPLIGCPAGMCIIKVCQDGVCKCPVNTCGESAEFDLNVNGCVCRAGLLNVQGQCLAKPQADAFCGKGHEWGERGGQQGCIAKSCAAGQPIDQGTGECKDVGAVASAIGIKLKHGETIGCARGEKLVTEGDHAACVPIAQTCAPDESFDGTSCVKAKSCGSGAVFDPDSGQCVAYGRAESDSFTIDTRSWALANYGKDGGMGTAKFCGAFAKRPWTFGLGEGQSAMVRVGLAFQFDGQRVATGTVRTTANFEHNGAAVPQKGADGVADAANAILGALKAGGGRANPAALHITVKCPVVSAGKPAAVPSVGGV